jgi:alanyl-tRNA synthetase
MKKLSTSELRKLYLDFFVARDHKLVKSDLLVPANDPSVLFTSAGMNQFKDHFLGKVKDFKRATSCQKCFRTGDLEEVGRTPFHHTFFEMLGNFSFGDYFKKEAIQWAWEFVTKVLEIDEGFLWVSVYEDDAQAFEIWKNDIGLPVSKIKKMGPKDNFWPSNAIANGPNGPCGPCSEIYYQKKNGESVEVWNLVFTQFNRLDGGVLEPLPNKNIDTGMGLERIASVLQGVESNFDIDIFVPIVEAAKKSSGVSDTRILHLLSDHARAVTFCIADGVLPSNDGRGYVVRKLIRRCSYLAQQKDAKPFLYKIVSSVAQTMGDQYPEILERRDNIAQIIKAEEEKYIRNILEGGAEKINEIKKQCKESGQLEVSAQIVSDLYMTHGIPVEYAVEDFKKDNLTVNTNLTFEIIKLEQDKTRDASKMFGCIFGKDSVELKKSEFVGYGYDSCEAKVVQIIKDSHEVKEASSGEDVGVVFDKTPFYAESGGQVADIGEIVLKGTKGRVLDTQKQKDSILHVVQIEGGSLKVGDKVEARVDLCHRQAVQRAHTSTHILQAVLRKVLGPHVQQAGSYVEQDRFRFDFTHFKEISDEEMTHISELLNEYILKNDKLSAQVMSKKEAQKTGAIALFGEKYEDEVRVVSVGDYSKEFCGGTHAQATGEIGLVYIISESSVGSGLRRIEALTGMLAFKQAKKDRELLNELSGLLRTKPDQLKNTLLGQLNRYKTLEKDSLKLKEKDLANQGESFIQTAKLQGDVRKVIQLMDKLDANLLRQTVDVLKNKISQKGVFVVASDCQDNAPIICACTQDLVSRGFDSDALLKKIASLVGGSGGGRKDFAQGGTKNVSELHRAWPEIERCVEETINKL